jgi:hypothetical protein
MSVVVPPNNCPVMGFDRMVTYAGTVSKIFVRTWAMFH